MYAIETELGRFEGETEHDAKRKLNRKVRESRKAAKQAEVDRGIANERAKSVAYKYLCRLVEGEGCPCGWRFYRRGEKYAAHATIEQPITTLGYYFSHVRAETEWGTLEMRDISSKFIGSVMDGSGYHPLVALEEKGVILWYAVGICNDMWALALVPGLSVEWFEKGAQS